MSPSGQPEHPVHHHAHPGEAAVPFQDPGHLPGEDPRGRHRRYEKWKYKYIAGVTQVQYLRAYLMLPCAQGVNMRVLHMGRTGPSDYVWLQQVRPARREGLQEAPGGPGVDGTLRGEPCD